MPPRPGKTTGKAGKQLPNPPDRHNLGAIMKTTRFLTVLAIVATVTTVRAGFFDEIRGDLTGPAVEGSPKYTALYFSAEWCPPCKMFTPKLVEWYKDFKAKHPEFELVFVSGDQSADAMENYIKEAGMPWPAVAFDKAGSEVFGKFSSQGIPYLVLIGDDGQPLTARPGNEWQSPTEVLSQIEKLVP